MIVADGAAAVAASWKQDAGNVVEIGMQRAAESSTHYTDAVTSNEVYVGWLVKAGAFRAAASVGAVAVLHVCSAPSTGNGSVGEGVGAGAGQ